MKRFAFWIFLGVVALAVLLFSCGEERNGLKGACGTPATVRDLSGLDGCSYVFELEDGTRLIAYWEWGWCGTPPLPEGATEDPLYNFEYVDGKKVLIGYEERPDVGGICMAGKMVKITCLEEVTVQEK
ncbi:MAG: hypothetical protein ACOYXA_15695 [Bacteroidota bacterium]